MKALVKVVKHQKESGFAFLLSTQAGSTPRLPLEPSPAGHKKARAYGKACYCGTLSSHEATLASPSKQEWVCLVP